MRGSGEPIVNQGNPQEALDAFRFNQAQAARELLEKCPKIAVNDLDVLTKPNLVERWSGAVQLRS
jgi:hypothetical protein